MRHTLIRVVAFAAAVLLVALVLKERPVTEADANTPLPENPFAAAREGDWATYVVLAPEHAGTERPRRSGGRQVNPRPACTAASAWRACGRG